MGRHFVTDCEGPISLNDNAQELSAHFIPRGERFFAIVSRYDDFLADVVEKPGYKAGDTLKLILPFLIAFGASNEAVRNYSRSHISLVPGATETLRFVGKRMASFIISTSYEPYIEALCEVVGFPMERAFSTEVDFDRYPLDPEEGAWLRQTAEELAGMEMLQWPGHAGGSGDLAAEHRRVLRQLDRIFWQAIPRMRIGRILNEVNPVGGAEKARALVRSLEGTGHDLADVMYVGDSITDTEALRLVKDRGGLAVSFNGNGYAVRSAQICCMSKDARIIAFLAEAFNREGRDGALDLVESWESGNLARVSTEGGLMDWLSSLPEKDFPRMERVSGTDLTRLIAASESFRRSVRGEQVGSLG
ncbi:MAG: hypothetical protein JRJ26_09215 [Deltaproteobacteria bacterium]|nr:hypothetical protein [Deltaproteobacteria bacterium]